jgi:hypothetical protein
VQIVQRKVEHLALVAPLVALVLRGTTYTKVRAKFAAVSLFVRSAAPVSSVFVAVGSRGSEVGC